MSVRVLSIDPGDLHFGFALLQFPVDVHSTFGSVQVLHLSCSVVHTARNISCNKQLRSLYGFLATNTPVCTPDVILIEHPNVGSKRMYMSAGAIYMYYTTVFPASRTFWVSPKVKCRHSSPLPTWPVYRRFRPTHPSEAHTPLHPLLARIRQVSMSPVVAVSRHARNKKLAVLLCTYYIGHVLQVSDSARQAFDTNNKKDDMADAMLQALAVIHEL